MESFLDMTSLRSTLLKRDKGEAGFTLIEILVVILIIGILAAIAIPAFLNQRQTANDAAAVSEATNISKAIETYFVDNRTERDLNDAALVKIKEMVKKTNGVGAVISGNADDYCIQTWHSNGKTYRNDNNWTVTRPYYIHSSKLGGNAYNSGYGGGISSLSCFITPNVPKTLWAP